MDPRFQKCIKEALELRDQTREEIQALHLNIDYVIERVILETPGLNPYQRGNVLWLLVKCRHAYTKECRDIHDELDVNEAMDPSSYSEGQREAEAHGKQKAAMGKLIQRYKKVLTVHANLSEGDQAFIHGRFINYRRNLNAIPGGYKTGLKNVVYNTFSREDADKFIHVYDYGLDITYGDDTHQFHQFYMSDLW